MRGIVFILPAFFSLYYVLRGRQDLAFLNVYLPCLIVLPEYYSFRVPHVPLGSAASWALLPLAISLLVYPVPRLQLRRLDLWIALYALTFATTEFLKEPDPKIGFLIFSSWVTGVLFAYIVGRRVIEPNLRVATIQRIVLLFLSLGPFIAYEYLKRNPWFIMASHFHVEIPASVSIREGHARIQASFVHAIIAGIMFFIVFLLNQFLANVYKQDKSRLGKITGWLERYHLPSIFLLMFLWLTQSRGPMLTTGVGYAVLQIPKFRHRKIAGLVVCLVLGIGGFAVYSYFDAYTNAIATSSMSEQQTSAIYRREMVKNYQPVIVQGGWLGWGAFNIPEAGGQKSLDNAYLIVQLGQGKIGYILFLLVIAEALWSTAYRGFSFHSKESRFLVFTLLAAMVGLFLCLTAVYLGPGLAPTCFLLLGWSQSVEDEGIPEPPFYFKRVFV